MATLHINNIRGQMAPIFKGMFGSIRDLSGEPDKVLFTYDPAIAACSQTLSAAGMDRSIKLRRDEVTTIEASECAINAIKANLAQGLITRWERGYSRVEGWRAMGEGLLSAEREVARAGIARLLAAMGNIAPHWIQTQQQVYLYPTSDDLVNRSFDVNRTGIANVDMQAAPIPRATDSNESAPYRPLEQSVNVNEVDGLYEANVAIPVYLPVVHVSPLRRLVQAFGFGRSADLTSEQAQLNEETLALIQTTYVLRELVIDGAKTFFVDGQSLVKVQSPTDDDRVDDSNATGSQPQRDRG